MSYTKTNWTNGSGAKINETNLNKIEQGIYDNDSSIGDISNLNTTATDLVGAINEVNAKTIWTLYDTTTGTDTTDIPNNYDELLVIAKDISTDLNITINIPKIYIDSLTTQNSFQSGYWQQGTAGGRASVVINPTTSKMWLNFMYINGSQVVNTKCSWYIR